MDYALIAAKGYQKGPVLVLSGAHGDMFGGLTAYPGIIKIEQGVFQRFNFDLEFIDIMKVSGARLKQALNMREGTVICSWCYSSTTKKMQRAFWPGSY